MLCLKPLNAGSSPHTRGARVGRGGPGASRGIIPAYAGSTHIDSRFFQLKRDHPRIRGEHEGLADELLAFAGSSPHTRGARVSGSRRARGAGIIPAYAGSTARKGAARGWYGDHPRIRGEHVLFLGCDRVEAGSSPHTRGART